jgi:hypothetical protein
MSCSLLSAEWTVWPTAGSWIWRPPWWLPAWQPSGLLVYWQQNCATPTTRPPAYLQQQVKADIVCALFFFLRT